MTQFLPLDHQQLRTYHMQNDWNVQNNTFKMLNCPLRRKLRQLNAGEDLLGNLLCVSALCR